MAIRNRIRGIKFPFVRSNHAFPEPSADVDSIKESVIQIVTTAKGERIMRPTFGCSAFDFVFESFSQDLQLSIEREVRQSISKWEPRVRVNSVGVSTDDITEPGQILIFIQYTVLLTNRPDSVVVGG